MKQILLSIGILTGVVGYSQVTDTVILGSGYTNQCWYSLENDEQANLVKNDWDIAFETGGFGSSININGAVGTKAWSFPGDTSQFMTLDTTGMVSWVQLHNSDTSWQHGALAQNQSGLDLGWGTYSVLTHIVTGDELFVLQLSDGSYQKLWIKSLESGIYTFRHATLDNVMDMTHTLTKSNFSGKNFGYFSLQTHQSVDKEPASADWDLIFGQYETSDIGWYLVSGVLSNYGTSVAKAYPVNDPLLYTDHSAHLFETEINSIGYNWKYFDFISGWTLSDSLVYFVETQSNDIWKLVFTDFSGSSAGQFVFNKEKISSVGFDTPKVQVLNAYPNPAQDQLNITYNSNEPVRILLMDMNGRLIKRWEGNEGLNTKTLQVSDINTGVYNMIIESDNGISSQKIMIK